MKPKDALEIAERDDIGQCATCSDLAMEDEQFCSRCKSYWEEDAPAFAEAEWRAEQYRMQSEFREFASQDGHMRNRSGDWS